MSFLAGALNFCEISGLGAVGVGFEDALKAKLNLPDMPVGDDAEPEAPGWDGPDGVEPAGLSLTLGFSTKGPLGGLPSLPASISFCLGTSSSLAAVESPWYLLAPGSSCVYWLFRADDSELPGPQGLVLGPLKPPRL